MTIGNVLWYNSKKGFGFIILEDGTQCFVHYSSLINKKSLLEKQKVNFDIIKGEKGLRAINVEVI
jgi:CspA family cold shock protein